MIHFEHAGRRRPGINLAGRCAPLASRILACAGLLIAACTDFKGAVRDAFATANTCPAERVTVQPHPEIAGRRIDPSRFATPARVVPGEPAPPEIQADPERLEMWRAAHPSVSSDGENTSGDADEVFEAQGCGITTWYGCTTVKTNYITGDGSQRVTEIACSPGVPPGPR